MYWLLRISVRIKSVTAGSMRSFSHLLYVKQEAIRISIQPFIPAFGTDIRSSQYRGLHVDHTTISRWVQQYASELEALLQKVLRPKNEACNSCINDNNKQNECSFYPFSDLSIFKESSIC